MHHFLKENVPQVYYKIEIIYRIISRDIERKHVGALFQNGGELAFE